MTKQEKIKHLENSIEGKDKKISLLNFMLIQLRKLNEAKHQQDEQEELEDLEKQIDAI